MPVPKRKTSKARRDKRQSTKFIRPKAVAKCPNCEYAMNPHKACSQCGFYKGKKVISTKLERALKRNEARRASETKQMQATQEVKETKNEE